MCLVAKTCVYFKEVLINMRWCWPLRKVVQLQGAVRSALHLLSCIGPSGSAVGYKEIEHVEKFQSRHGCEPKERPQYCI